MAFRLKLPLLLILALPVGCHQHHRNAPTQRPHDVILTWHRSTSAVIGYNVYRSIDGSQFILMKRIVGDAETWTDVGVPCGVPLRYKVSAAAANAESFTPPIDVAPIRCL